MMDAVDTLGRAIKILEQHVSMLQQKGEGADKIASLTQSFQALLDAASLSLHDKSKLQSLLQSQQQQSSEADDEFADVGAPAPAVYKGHSKGIVEVLEDMLDKAEEQLSEARKEETVAKHNYEMLKQSLEDEIKFDTEEKAAATKNKAESEEAKAVAEGDLDVTTKDLADAEKALKEAGMECMAQAEAHEIATKSRAEELKALAEAKKILQEMTAPAVERTYSFLQLGESAGLRSQVKGRAGLAGIEAVT